MTLIYIIVALIFIVFILSSIAPKNYEANRSIQINKPVEIVYTYLKHLKNQDNWAKWNRIDPEMEKKYSGEDGTVGFESYWNSQDKRVGEGKQTISHLVENERVDTLLEFIRPFKSKSDAYLTTEKIDANSTLVTWGFTGRMNPPMNILLLFMNMDKQIGADFEEGLEKLKEILENG
ncbi:SRPBCC family protein [Membranihabitans maritimus]|uniref:SRPBCC family protein n=1 Tax=Membranihabitans maritimus TaxID=2904244 RepID=UPI001F2732C0|nr:SRPBCC family protein [Membranihabitans maritimus]